jgi:hypothetical protein
MWLTALACPTNVPGKYNTFNYVFICTLYVCIHLSLHTCIYMHIVQYLHALQTFLVSNLIYMHYIYEYVRFYNMCLFVFTYMYLCIYLYIRIYVHIYIYLYIYVYIYLSIYICMYIHILTKHHHYIDVTCSGHGACEYSDLSGYIFIYTCL